jgi:hypothetical protein
MYRDRRIPNGLQPYVAKQVGTRSGSSWEIVAVTRNPNTGLMEMT